MDMRRALAAGTRLLLADHDGHELAYTIQREIGRGGSCIVYEAVYTTNIGGEKPVRVKECYPFDPRPERAEDGSLQAAPGSEQALEREKQRFREAYLMNERLFRIESLMNSVTNTVDLYEYGNTCYVVSGMLGGETLREHRCATLRECVSLVRGTALAIRSIHRAGYLYLDLKPENVFVIRGTTELTQLFDFDSLVSIEAAQRGTPGRISYTRGYAAPELRMGRRLGTYTDVYSVGAMLFVLLFGRTPCAADCEPDAVYDAEALRFPISDYPDRLLPALTALLHAALAAHVPDRLPDMEALLARLEPLLPLTDPQRPFLHACCPGRPAGFVGREEELRQLDELLRSRRTVGLSGPGGIGKSTLARAYLCRYRDRTGTPILCRWSGSARALIIDDDCVALSTVSRMREESADEYLVRKSECLRAVLREQPTLLVIDGADMIPQEELDRLESLGWSLLILTRRRLTEAELRLGTLREEELLRVLAGGLGRPLEPCEYGSAQRLIRHVGGHTLAVELIGRQLRAGLLSLERAEALVAEHGFAAAIPEQVEHCRDGRLYRDTVPAILDRLLDEDRLPEETRTLLFLLSLFGEEGIDAELFRALSGIASKDPINTLIGCGWFLTDRERLRLHPVTIDWLRGRARTERERESVRQLSERLYARLYPAGLPEDADRRYGADTEGFYALLSVAERLVSAWTEHTSERQRLLYRVTMDAPLDKEEAMLSGAEALLSEPEKLAPGGVLRLYSEMAMILDRMDRPEDAEAQLVRMRDFLRRHFSLYYSSVADQVQALLLYNRTVGSPDRASDELCLRLLERAALKARLSRHREAPKQLAECLLMRATTLMTVRKPALQPCGRLIEEATELAERHAGPYDELRYHCFCRRAMYHAIVTGDGDRAVAALREADRIADEGRDSDLSWIDHIRMEVVPLCIELGRWDEAEERARDALALCRRHRDSIPYQRAGEQLFNFLRSIPK